MVVVVLAVEVVSLCVGAVGEVAVLVLLKKFHDEDEDFVGAVVGCVGGGGDALLV